jgi:hypothetical protein
MKLIGRLGIVGKIHDGVLEGKKSPRIHLESQVEVQRTSTSFFGMKIHLPGLAKGVGLHEVPLVVNVEPMVHRMILEVGHVPGYVDDGHGGEPTGGRRR